MPARGPSRSRDREASRSGSPGRVLLTGLDITGHTVSDWVVLGYNVMELDLV